jgi:hypothetical protein
MEERELFLPRDQPLVAWRLFRARLTEGEWLLSAPLIHDPGYERFLGGAVAARCYDSGSLHQAPARGCRCGLYAAIEGTLDSLPGYLLDSAHDPDPPVYAEVACSGRVFVDLRGVRAERLDVRRLATSPTNWPSPSAHAAGTANLRERYEVEVAGLDVVPAWVLSNMQSRGAPPDDATLDLDVLGLWKQGPG